ncbi:MAG: DMT family protein [Phycisphaerae bacterium]|nr:DMT family protein [Phycisphaerae bacterium]
MGALSALLLLVCSDIFMTWAWYGPLKRVAWTLPVAIGLSWLIALPECALQAPANRLGHVSQGGPFTAPQLKILQGAITLVVFVGFFIVVLKEKPRANDPLAFALILAGVVVSMLGRNGTPAVRG